MRETHNPGGRVLRRPPGVVSGHAVFAGPADCYRYKLEWDSGERGDRTLLAILMNPSTATAETGDATVNKLWRMALAQGFRRLLVGNVFAYRATSPAMLAKADDPVGPGNLTYLLKMAHRADQIVMGYGQHTSAALNRQGPTVAADLVACGYKLNAWRVGVAGVPWHPLYLPDDTVPQPWAPL